jgi:hypothetical protein
MCKACASVLEQPRHRPGPRILALRHGFRLLALDYRQIIVLQCVTARRIPQATLAMSPAFPLALIASLLGAGACGQAGSPDLRSPPAAGDPVPPGGPIEPPPPEAPLEPPGIPTAAPLLFEDQFVDFSQWSIEKCCDHSQTIQSSPAHEGNTAAWFDLKRVDPPPVAVFNPSHRSELLRPHLVGWGRDENGPFKSGDEVWYGFSIYIPSDWVNDSQDQEVLQQIHNTPENKAGTSSPDWSVERSPFLALIGENGNFRWWVLTNPGKYGTSAWVQYPKQDYVYTGTITKGAWTDWVIHAKWSYQSDGRLEIWRDGVKVVDRTGPNSYNETNPGYFKMGIYKWSWGNTSVTERVVGYDNLRIAGADANYWNVVPRSETAP